MGNLRFDTLSNIQLRLLTEPSDLFVKTSFELSIEPLSGYHLNLQITSLSISQSEKSSCLSIASLSCLAIFIL